MSIVLSARQAEDANRDLAKIARTGNSGLMLVPVEARGAPSGGTRTPRIHLSKAGEFLAKPVPTPGAGSSSGAPRQRIGSVPGQRRPREDAASSRPAPPAVPGLAASVTQQRSKRPKGYMPQRNSYGGADTSEKHKALVPCRRLLNELMKHQFAGPFLKPVDPLAVPGYYDVIKDVIDLGTIKKRLEANQYEDIEEFESEVKRVWGNCYKFNQGVNDDIVKMAKTLEEVFDEKMQSVTRDGDGGEASKQMKNMQREMMRMQKQMQEQQKLMKQQNELQQQAMQLQPYAAPAPNARRQSTGGGGRRNSSAGATAQQSTLAALQASAQQQDESAEMTFELKAALGGGINRLTSNNLAKVVELIRQNMPSLGAGQEEIEIDINALDNRTLWKLHNFVQSCGATKKRAPKRPAETADSRARAIAQAQADTAQQLTQADAGLRAYEQSSGPQGIALQQQDDNDSPADSDSDSDDDGAASLLPPANATANGSGSQWADFQNSKKQRDREQLEKNAQAARAIERAQHQAGAIQRDREQQRAAERAQHDSEDGNLNLLGQSNMMASFTEGGGEGDGLDFQLDEYGGGM